MGRIAYNKIIAYKISSETTTPLHIGGYLGGMDEILIHATTGEPFIQASTLTGMMRSVSNKVNYNDITNDLFGLDRFKENQNSNEVKSRVNVSDGIFESDSVIIEKRPGVKIDGKTGTVNSQKSAGQKFDISYISSGAKFSYLVYLYMSNEEEKDRLEDIFGAIKSGIVSIGAKKSSGSGKFKITSIKRKIFDLKNEVDRNAWISYDSRDENNDFNNVTDEINNNRKAFLYDISIKAKTEGPIQVRGIDIEDFSEDAPDSENMLNGRKEYIIPGTSFRGAIRSQMEKIAKYIDKEYIIDNSFGLEAKNHSESKSGNLIFNEAVFNDSEMINNNPVRNRIHIDKLTGGVISQGLFCERNASGKLDFSIQIKDKLNPDATLGLLLYALRDLAAKTFNLGNGYAMGKGFLDIEEICIYKSDDTVAVIEFKPGDYLIKDESEMIKKAFESLKTSKSQREEAC